VFPALITACLNHWPFQRLKEYFPMRKIHHYTPMPDTKPCAICGKDILNAWFDANEKNGRSETFVHQKDGSIVHYFCLPNAKTLQQLNEERKNKH
jgi:hypothetical protein